MFEVKIYTKENNLIGTFYAGKQPYFADKIIYNLRTAVIAWEKAEVTKNGNHFKTVFFSEV